MMKRKRTIYVYADWQGLDGPLLMGFLHAELLRGKEVFSFEYDHAWLRSEHAQSLDPDLQLYPVPQYLNDIQKSNFGVFLDSSPDRWGRVLMRRREAALARKESRPVQTLFETDYLMGVYDEYRMGALRFKENENGPFLNDNTEMVTPPWTSLQELEQISLHLEEDEATENPEYIKWLNILMAPGSSLGGARPKAGVQDKQKNLWIAKFPSRADKTNIGGWEMVVHELALKAGINVPEAKAQKFSSPYFTFLTKRFDRHGKRQRIHFVSAMTMLGYIDGQNYQEGISYLDLAEFITVNGARVKEDLEELWRRIVFNICTSNTDDHLRNHGFTFSPKGWSLSPAYDLNPDETGNGLSLNISENENALELELAMEVHPYFRLKEKTALEIMKTVTEAVSSWQDVANKYGIKKSEQELKNSAFRAAVKAVS